MARAAAAKITARKCRTGSDYPEGKRKGAENLVLIKTS